MKKSQFLTFFALASLGVICRLLPHLPSFAPIAAISLFAGFYFRGVRWTVLPTLIAMLVSDLFLGFYDVRILVTVYAALLIPVFLGCLLRERMRPMYIVLTAVLGSTLFYVTTNFSVWAFSGMYQSNWEGLIRCYVSALPFLKFTVLGDVTWAGIIFGTFALARAWNPPLGRLALCPE